MKFGIPSRENALFLNILLGIDDLDANFGPTIDSNFMKFGTKNKWNILIDTNCCLDSGQISFYN